MMNCECCQKPFDTCDCGVMSPPPCQRCYHCYTHCDCGALYDPAGMNPFGNKETK